MDIIGALGAQPDFSSVAVLGLNVGRFVAALVAFVIMSAVVYLGVVKPYERFKGGARRSPLLTKPALRPLRSSFPRFATC